MRIYYSGEAGQNWGNPEEVFAPPIPHRIMFTYAHVNVGKRMRKRFFIFINLRKRRKLK